MKTSRAAKPTPKTATSERFFWWIRFNHASGVFILVVRRRGQRRYSAPGAGGVVDENLPVARDFNLLTHIEQGTGGTFRPHAGANVFAERDGLGRFFAFVPECYKLSITGFRDKG